MELQAASANDSAERLLLRYLPRLLTEPAAEGSLTLTAAGGVVVNLTGPPQPGGLEQRPTVAPDCWLAGGILQRNLRNEDAVATLRDITAGSISRWLLAWLPLMQSGSAADIIIRWRREALREPDQDDLGILAGLTLTFAALCRNRAVWDRGLEGIDVIKSPYLEELREKVRILARAEGKEEGKAEGRVETLREAILRLGRQRYGKPASRKQKAQLNAITDVARLERIHDRILSASAWEDFLGTP